MNTRTVVLASCLLASAAARADVVTVTPGVISGTIHYEADYVPDQVRVDAANPPAEAQRYTAQGYAVFAGTTATGSLWTYELTVEAALTSSYWVRPIALVTSTNNHAAFPDQGPVSVVPFTTATFDITYMPAVLHGTTTLSDLGGDPLALRTFYLNAFDTATSAIPDTLCGNSVNFCAKNSRVNTTLATYSLYLKPGAAYLLGSQAFSVDETEPGLPAYSTGEWDFLVPYTAPAAGGMVDVRDYAVEQRAEVSGQIQLAGLTVYQISMSASGLSTTAGKTFGVQYQTFAPTSDYVLRLYDFTSFAAPVYLRPAFTLSPDGFALLQFRGTPIAVADGQSVTYDFTGAPAFVNGDVDFVPPRDLLAGSYVQVVTPDGAALGQNWLSASGAYDVAVYPDTWEYWRFQWNFAMDPGFSANYFIGNFLPLFAPGITADGQTVTHDFTFDTALVKVYFTAPNNGTLSDPRLDALLESVPLGLRELASGEGLGQVGVTNGEARVVLRVNDPPASFAIRPSAVIGNNPSRTDFSPFTVTPQAGQVIVLGVASPLVLTLSSPHDGDSFASCSFTVNGTAGGTPVASVTVNGVPAALTSTGNPGDPNEVAFSAALAGAAGANPIVVTATDVAANSLTESLTVSCTAPPPCVPSASVAVSSLWPPKHDLVDVGHSATCSAAVTVWSDEDDEEQSGDGRFSPDAKLAGASLRLRAERRGNGDGRVYLVIATASGGRACSTVVVPHAQSAAAIAAVNAQAAAARAHCNATGAAPAGFFASGDGPVIGPKQ